MLKNYALDQHNHDGEKRNSFSLMQTFNKILDLFGSGFIHIQLQPYANFDY